MSLNKFKVTYRYRGEDEELEDTVSAVTARDALTVMVRKHENDAAPIVLLGVRGV